MEDPVRFDVWGEGGLESRAFLQERLGASFPGRPRVSILRDVARAVHSRRPLAVFYGLGWEEARRRAQETAAVLTNVRIFQEGYGPDEEADMNRCPRHQLWYGGCLGCPVCDARHAP
jgi:hypothetical protein